MNAVVGSIWDVVVDIRVQSPTYGLSVAIELSADNGKHLYIPVGFAHGVCTLTDHAEIRYKVSAPYSKDHDHGIAWDDPEIGIVWPITREQAILSDKDRRLPCLKHISSPFV